MGIQRRGKECVVDGSPVQGEGVSVVNELKVFGSLELED